MKKSLLFIIPVLLFIAGCTKSDLGPTSPAPETQKYVIPLPLNNSLNIENSYSVSEVIEGSRGGMIRLNESYYSQQGKVSIKAKLQIPSDAFAATVTIGYEVNDGEASIDFFPQMNFDKDLLLDLKFSGLDLSGYNPNEIQFVYVAPDGNTYPVQYSSMTVDVQRGILDVKDAVINHFSRYIWTR